MDDMAHTPKYTELDTAEDNRKTFNCLLPPHKPLIFANYAGFESHYNQNHTNRCRECGKNFPSNYFLDLHLTENHDPIVATKRERGEKTYACFVEGCDKICLEWRKRRSHLVDKHGFPRNYDFLIVDNGIDGRWTMLRPGVDANGHRKSSRERGMRDSSATVGTQTTEASSITLATDSVVEGGIEGDVKRGSISKAMAAKTVMPAKSKTVSMDDVTKSMSSLQFVPRSVTFGKKKGKSGFAKK